MKQVVDIFWQFLRLGLMSFGGPAAHLGYFHHRFVEQLHWLSAEEYQHLIVLSQFLPGPSSSQVGFAIGLTRGGRIGGWAAFLGFTLPSFLLLLMIALWQPAPESTLFSTLIASLKLLAVIVVADACLSMYQTFSRTRLTQSVTVVIAMLLLLFPSSLWLPLMLLTMSFVIGWRWCPTEQNTIEKTESPQVPHSMILIYGLGLFILLLIGVYWLLPEYLSPSLQLLAQFMQAGSLVFGGGHVVLPLLEPLVADQVGQDLFLSGYALAQAVPGPMFTFATYLGALMLPQAPVEGAILATLGVFLPGLLLMQMCYQRWQTALRHPRLQGGVFLLNAAVVGLLLAVLIHPVMTSAIHGLLDLSIVIIGFAIFRRYRPPILWLLLFFGALLPLLQITFIQ